MSHPSRARGGGLLTPHSSAPVGHPQPTSKSGRMRWLRFSLPIFWTAQMTLSISSLSAGHAISRVAEGVKTTSLFILPESLPLCCLKACSLGFRRLVVQWKWPSLQLDVLVDEIIPPTCRKTTGQDYDAPRQWFLFKTQKAVFVRRDAGATRKNARAISRLSKEVAIQSHLRPRAVALHVAEKKIKEMSAQYCSYFIFNIRRVRLSRNS
eukprot:scaffold16927_cov113-Skeletonema_dohrnii-CCMP3373.AAC.2